MENDNEQLNTQESYHKHCYCAGPKCCSCGEIQVLPEEKKTNSEYSKPYSAIEIETAIMNTLTGSYPAAIVKRIQERGG